MIGQVTWAYAQGTWAGWMYGQVTHGDALHGCEHDSGAMDVMSDAACCRGKGQSASSAISCRYCHAAD
jgi:hypothetical protein